MYMCVTLSSCLSCIVQFIISFIFIATLCHVEFFFFKNVIKSVSHFYDFQWSGIMFKKVFLTSNIKECYSFLNFFYYLLFYM